MTAESAEPPASHVPPLATRMAGMPMSAVREILKVTERPDILSFAGGLPAPELFPIAAIAQASLPIERASSPGRADARVVLVAVHSRLSTIPKRMGKTSSAGTAAQTKSARHPQIGRTTADTTAASR